MFPMLLSGADDGNRTRVFSLGSIFHLRTGVRRGPATGRYEPAKWQLTWGFRGYWDGVGTPPARARFGAVRGTGGVRMASQLELL